MKRTSHRARRTLTALLVAITAVTVTSCIEGDDVFIAEPDAAESLFDRYISLGNSITAGFQSGGIVGELQQQAYPVLLAQKAGAGFGIPSLRAPGCPPPLVGPLTTQRTSQIPCALRSYDAPELVQNLAVPGANTGHVSNELGTDTILNTLITGGRSQIDAMRAADPTLVSVWIGNNDALGAALGGDTLALTPMSTFQAEYDEIVSAILETDAQDAILIGVANPMTAAPALQPGAYFWAIAQQPPPGLPPLDVSDNCAPFDPLGNPNPGGSRLVSFLAVASQIAAGADTVRVDCSAQAPGLLNQDEMVTIGTRIAMFNGYIEQQATANEWIYVDPADVLEPALADPNLIRKCQGLATATDQSSFMAAVMNTCPVDLDPTTEVTFFGSYFSFDGVHPSSSAHAAVANALAEVINAAHGLALPVN